jgi:LmbE family N-acetylglucosaminyl deacetylase
VTVVLLMLLCGRRSRTLATGRSLMVLAPHPDDETLGCGAILARRYQGGGAVAVVVVTDGAGNPPGRDAGELVRLRRAEVLTAMARLGIDEADVRFLGLADGALEGLHNDLVRLVSDLVAELEPDDVLVTSAGESHADHAALGRAARHACAGTQVRLWSYPIWQWQESRSLVRLVTPRCEYVATSAYREAKRRAIAAFATQLGPVEDGGLPTGLLRACCGRWEFFHRIPCDLPRRGGSVALIDHVARTDSLQRGSPVRSPARVRRRPQQG